MKHEEILASVSVMVLAGVIVYATKVGLIAGNMMSAKKDRVSASQASDSAAIQGAGGDPNALISGPSIYLSNTPYPYWPPVGNVIPSNSGFGSTQAGATGDFLGFFAQ